MTFSWDFNTATLLAIAAQIIIFIVYLVKTNGKAVAAYELAEQAMECAKDAHEKIILTNASVSLVREQYVHDDDLRSMEARLTVAINNIGTRLDHALDKRLPK